MDINGEKQPGKNMSNTNKNNIEYQVTLENIKYPRHTIFKLCVLLLLGRIVWILTEVQNNGSFWG